MNVTGKKIQPWICECRYAPLQPMWGHMSQVFLCKQDIWVKTSRFSCQALFTNVDIYICIILKAIPISSETGFQHVLFSCLLKCDWTILYFAFAKYSHANICLYKSCITGLLSSYTWHIVALHDSQIQAGRGCSPSVQLSLKEKSLLNGSPTYLEI